MMAEEELFHVVPAAAPESRKIVVVGACAAGKSTLVSALRGLGYDAHVSGQEHSEIATLWQHSQPDVLIALDVDITAVRDRRGGSWPNGSMTCRYGGWPTPRWRPTSPSTPLS